MTPLPSHPPRWVIERSRPRRIELTSDGYHMVTIIPFCQTSTQEHSPDVTIISNITSAQPTDGHMQVPFEDLYSHRGFLLPDAWKLTKPLLKYGGSRGIIPAPLGSSSM